MTHKSMIKKKTLMKKKWSLIAALTSSAVLFAAQEVCDYTVTVDEAVTYLHRDIQDLVTELNDENSFDDLRKSLFYKLEMDVAHNAVGSTYNLEQKAQEIPFDYALKKFNKMRERLRAKPQKIKKRAQRKTFEIMSAQDIQGFTISPSGEMIVTQFENPAPGWYEDCRSALIASYPMEKSDKNNLAFYGSIALEAGEIAILHQDQDLEKDQAVYRHHLAHSPTSSEFAFIRTQRIAGQNMNHLILFNPQTGARGAKKLAQVDGEVMSLAFSKTGEYILGNVRDEHGTISYAVWDAGTGALVENPNDDALLFFPPSEITQNRSLIAYSADSVFMAVATPSLDGTTSTISVLEHEPYPDLGHTNSFDIKGQVKAVVFSQDGKRVAITSTIPPNVYEIIEVWRIDNPENAHLEKRIKSQNIDHALFSYDKKMEKESVIYKTRIKNQDHIFSRSLS
jgi:hypothetical protein